MLLRRTLNHLVFAHREIPCLNKLTKRDALRYSSQIYDPLGLLSPVTVRAKLLMQQLWREKFDWDVPLPINYQEAWSRIAKDLNTVTTIEFPRHYGGSSPSSSLHVFVDASISSYGAAAYIVNGTESTIVMAMNIVAPLQKETHS